MGAFQMGKAPPVLFSIRSELGMNLLLAGWVLSIFNVIRSFLGSMVGAAADAFGYRRFLLTGIGLQAIGSFAGSFAQGAPFLLAIRSLEGIGLLAIAVVAPAMIAQVTSPQDTRVALAVWSCFLPIGLATIMFSIPLVTFRLTWRGLWQINGAILIAYAFWVMSGTANLFGGSTQTRRKGGLPWQDLFRTVSSAGPVLLAGTFLIYGLEWLAVMGFLPTMLIEEYGFNSGRASALTATMVATNIPGNLLSGWLFHRGCRQWKLIALSSILMGSCSLGIYSPALPFLIRYISCLVFWGSAGC